MPITTGAALGTPGRAAPPLSSARSSTSSETAAAAAAALAGRGRLGAAPSAASSKRWVNEYRSQRAKWDEDRRQDKAEEDAAKARRLEHASHAQHDHRVFLLDLSTALPPISPASVRPTERWREVWGRNDICEQSGLPTSPGARLECAFCPVVVRHDRAQRMYSSLRIAPSDCRVSTVGERALEDGVRTQGASATEADVRGGLHGKSKAKSLLQSAATRAVGERALLAAQADGWVCAQCVHDCRANRRNMARVRHRQAASWSRQRSAMLITAFMRRACDRHRFMRIQVMTYAHSLTSDN